MNDIIGCGLALVALIEAVELLIITKRYESRIQRLIEAME